MSLFAVFCLGLSLDVLIQDVKVNPNQEIDSLISLLSTKIANRSLK